jgi:hypothetical protein
MEDNNMKKTYIIPTTEVVEVEICQMINASKKVLSGEITDPSKILSPMGGSFDEDEDFDFDFDPNFKF